MNPKEKAKELFDKMYFNQLVSVKFNTTILAIEISKECAIIAADEVLGYMGADRGTEFWLEVRSEIKKL